MKYFCITDRAWRRTPCVHGTCRLMDYKKPASISEKQKRRDEDYDDSLLNERRM